jgi:hypothetical protein
VNPLRRGRAGAGCSPVAAESAGADAGSDAPWVGEPPDGVEVVRGAVAVILSVQRVKGCSLNVRDGWGLVACLKYVSRRRGRLGRTSWRKDRQSSETSACSLPPPARPPQTLGDADGPADTILTSTTSSRWYFNSFLRPHVSKRRGVQASERRTHTARPPCLHRLRRPLCCAARPPHHPVLPTTVSFPSNTRGIKLIFLSAVYVHFVSDPLRYGAATCRSDASARSSGRFSPNSTCPRSTGWPVSVSMAREEGDRLII